MGDILIVDDQPAVADLVAFNLRWAGYTVRVAHCRNDALREVALGVPDVVLLDGELPDGPGIDLATRWRGEARTEALPIILFSRQPGVRRSGDGLDNVDDCLPKPFALDELKSRIESVLMRRRPEATIQPQSVGGLSLNPTTRRVCHGEHELRMSATEFRLLRFFIAHPERVHSRAQVLQRVWGGGHQLDERTVDVHIKRLREAMQPAGCAHMLQTVRGAGYRLTAAAPSVMRGG